MKYIIKSDGFYKDETKLSEDNIVSSLRYIHTIEPGVTLKNIFDAVAKSPLLIAFLNLYTQCDANVFLEEIQKKSSKQDRNEPLTRLELTWIADSDDDEVDFSVDFHAFGPITDYHKTTQSYTPTNENEEICYGVGFVSVSDLANLPVTLNSKLKIFEPLSANNLYPKLLLTRNRPFSLLDILDGIFYEISFYGSPKQRDEKKEELLGIVADIKSEKLETEPFLLSENN